jgi:hypothetical protein
MNKDTSKPIALYIYFLHTAIVVIIKQSLGRVVVMIFCILKKSNKKSILTSSPNRILRLIFNDGSVVFIKNFA